MGYGEVWKILDSLVMEFRRRGEVVPSNVVEDLRAGKTMIQILSADPSRTENIPSIEGYLNNVESYLMFSAQQKFGAEFVETWMAKINEARKTVHGGEQEKAWGPSSKFVTGLPRGKKWVRVQVTAETPKSEIRKMAGEFQLSTRMQSDGFVLVSGDEEKLKLFVHEIGEKLRRAKGR